MSKDRIIKAIEACALALSLSVAGCAHSLDVCNLDRFRSATEEDFSRKGLEVNVICKNGGDASAWMYCEQLSAQMARKAGYVVKTTGGDADETDFTVQCDVQFDESGSGMNFLVSWPGFVIFTPAWLGYSYDVDISVHCKIASSTTGDTVGEFDEKQDLHIRYADFGSTWGATGAGWFFWTVPAAINGIFVIGYDDDITPELYTEAYPVLCEAIASKCIAIINAYDKQ